ncbi:MAG: hypothetical protein ACI83H_000270 [Glaciecola sp.]|jgi:hypothetical protein
MKKNLLAAIVIFFFTFIVLMVMSDINNSKNPQIETSYYPIED